MCQKYKKSQGQRSNCTCIDSFTIVKMFSSLLLNADKIYIIKAYDKMQQFR